jgi:hypothetical protein
MLIKNRNDEAALDRCEAAYRAEYECWRVVRRGGAEHGYQLLREPPIGAPSSKAPKSDSVAFLSIYCEGAHSYTDAEIWLNTYRGRAAMRAALEAY